jgi:hypothetical protein
MDTSRDDLRALLHMSLEVFKETRRFLKHVFVRHTFFQAGKLELQAYIFLSWIFSK